jgi:PadR family transcriptional regulator AphA
MALQQAILGFLSRSPMTGYELGKHFDQSVNYAWAASLSQIYRELGALEEDGLITSRRERQEDRPDKRIYSITDAGNESFLHWIRSYPEKMLAEKRDEFMLRIIFGSEMGKAELGRQLSRYIEKQKALKAGFAHAGGMPSKRLRALKGLSLKPGGMSSICLGFLFRRANMVTDALIRWAEGCINELDRLD